MKTLTKKFVALMVLGFTPSAFALTTVCSSADFNPQHSVGQSLRLQSTDSTLEVVDKMPGSAYCDSRRALAPKVIGRTTNVLVYALDFGCDELNGRLIVPIDFTAKRKVVYEFSDPEKGRAQWVLNCK
jgi:hypothetical protein